MLNPPSSGFASVSLCQRGQVLGCESFLRSQKLDFVDYHAPLIEFQRHLKLPILPSLCCKELVRPC